MSCKLVKTVCSHVTDILKLIKTHNFDVITSDSSHISYTCISRTMNKVLSRYEVHRNRVLHSGVISIFTVPTRWEMHFSILTRVK